jgi:lysyl-tRNA synthetase class II
MKKEFTSEQLYEIEKVFDNQAVLVEHEFAHLISKLGVFMDNEKIKKYVEKVIEELTEAYNTCREISAICKAKGGESGLGI